MTNWSGYNTVTQTYDDNRSGVSSAVPVTPPIVDNRGWGYSLTDPTAKVLTSSGRGGGFGFFTKMFDTITSNLGRILAGTFTLGLTEIPIGDKRLGEASRLEPFYSGLYSGGNIVTGTTSENEKNQWGLAFKSGTALAGVSAATAGTSYSLSGNLGTLSGTPPPDPLMFGPGGGVTFLQNSPSTPPSFLTKIGWYVQGSGMKTIVGNGVKMLADATGNIGTSLIRIVTGDLVGGVQSLFNPPAGPMPPPTMIGWNPYGPSSGGGGGGGSGLGIMSQGKTGLSSINPVWYWVGGIGLVALVVWMVRRK